MMTEASTSGDEPARGAAGIRPLLVVFLGMISLPLLFGTAERGNTSAAILSADTLRGKLRVIEDDFAKQSFFETWRNRDQARLTRWLHEGNTKVIVGGKGWLHYRADVDAVTGKGPYYDEPRSVARAPGLRPWQRPGPVIHEFAAQLRDRGVGVTLVPVPTKSMLVDLEGKPRVLIPPGYTRLLDDLRSGGVEVWDLLPYLSEPESFLAQDTHWTPGAMERVAEALAGVMRDRLTEPIDALSTRVESIRKEMRGDLVGMLVPDEASLIPFLMPVDLPVVRDVDGGKLSVSDPASPLVLLGDSFVNVYDDPALGFSGAGDNDGALGGGLASHLMHHLGFRLHVIASNGGGASGVRKAFAALPDEVVRSKQHLIWVLSARDLLLAEIPGRRAGIEWERVEFSTRKAPPAGSAEASEVVVTAVLRERSGFGDPGTTPYSSALYSVILESVEVERGGYPHSEAHVFLWAFRDREVVESGRLVPGKRYRFTLVPFPASGEVAQTMQLDDFFRPDLERMFAEAVEEIP